MQPDAIGVHAPCFVRSEGEHGAAKAETEEAIDQTEVGDFHRAVVLAHKFDKTGAVVSDEAFPYPDVRRGQQCLQLLVGPRIAIAPVPGATHVAIQAPIVLRRIVDPTNEARVDVRFTRGSQLFRRPELEECANDFDRSGQSALIFSR